MSRTKSKQLLVEGNDDMHVVLALCEKFNLKENFDIIDLEGIDTLLKNIPVRLKTDNLETLGIIIDADKNISAQWEKLKKIFANSGYATDGILSLDGFIQKNPDGIKIGVWIMPNNHLPGMLEDFIKFLIPPDDKLMSVVQAHLENIEENNLNKYNKEIYKSKALVHSWLAVQENPGTPLGQSITKKYLTTDSETCSIFINWLKELYEDEN